MEVYGFKANKCKQKVWSTDDLSVRVKTVSTSNSSAFFECSSSMVSRTIFVVSASVSFYGLTSTSPKTSKSTPVDITEITLQEDGILVEWESIQDPYPDIPVKGYEISLILHLL